MNRFPFFLICVVHAVMFVRPGAAQDEHQYTLRYDFKAGEAIRYKVEQLATIDTRISGTSQEAKSKTASTKVWRVGDVTDSTMKFIHAVEDVYMWRKETGRQEVIYDSTKDENPPEEFKSVAQTLNTPLAIVTIDRSGEIVKREKSAGHPDLGFGGLVVPLPKEKVKLGDTWDVPNTLFLRDENGFRKAVQTRLRYELEKVEAGVATISVKTQILTPIHKAQLKSQLVQQTSAGKIKFDIDAGRVISKHLDWDESVVGFNGPDSNLKYLAQFTEQLVDSKTANAKTTKARR